MLNCNSESIGIYSISQILQWQQFERRAKLTAGNTNTLTTHLSLGSSLFLVHLKLHNSGRKLWLLQFNLIIKKINNLVTDIVRSTPYKIFFVFMSHQRILFVHLKGGKGKNLKIRLCASTAIDSHLEQMHGIYKTCYASVTASC